MSLKRALTDGWDFFDRKLANQLCAFFIVERFILLTGETLLKELSVVCGHERLTYLRQTTDYDILRSKDGRGQ